MTLPPPIYDLVVLLDTQADDATRAKLLADTRAAIEAQGELLREDDWGVRALAYPIAHQASAEYHLMQFHTPASELLEGLERTLRIADEVLRFRIIKLAPGVPEAPQMAAGSSPLRRAEGEGEPEQSAPPAPSADQDEAPAPPAPAAAEIAVGEPS